jgi:hypothetical protein
MGGYIGKEENIQISGGRTDISEKRKIYRVYGGKADISEEGNRYLYCIWMERGYIKKRETDTDI